MNKIIFNKNKKKYSQYLYPNKLIKNIRRQSKPNFLGSRLNLKKVFQVTKYESLVEYESG
ncbi:hypothetical protein ETSB_1372 [cyanobacterium endosymbiont of Epithemia turgida isolate EtSB Lake Yunoko]|nr:hypothetical protein ETSB_1372 [cyanobacterium endosymbiont of Epithemia turgida isolate EtSB Lake Yunoko]